MDKAYTDEMRKMATDKSYREGFIEGYKLGVAITITVVPCALAGIPVAVDTKTKVK